MKPNQPKSETSSLNLPQPSFEASELKKQPVRQELDYQIPKPAGSPLQASAAATTTVVPVAGVNPTPAGNQSAAPVSSNSALANVPHAAGDIDLMEKEWMIRAKHILSTNRNNPYEQSKEITSLRTNYLKKRFNKELKATDG